MQRDLNKCTARQLTCLPGIDTRLADGIIQYRQKQGQLKHFDEVWQVAGMTRSTYHLLRRHYKVVGEKTPVVGGKLPNARLSLTESMSFVCQGQPALQQNQQVPRTPSAEMRKKAFNFTRNHKAKNATALNSKSGVPVTKILLNRERSFPLRTATSKYAHQSRDKLNKTTRIESSPVVLQTTTGTQPESQQTIVDSYQNDIELLQALAPSKARRAWPQSDKPEKPSLTLKTSPSGNNINLSCTIDKRMLHENSSMAFQLDDNIPLKDTETRKPSEQVQTKGNPTAPPMKMEQSSSASEHSEFEKAQVLNPVVIPSPTGHNFPALTSSSDQPSGYSSLLTTTATSCINCCKLSEENVLIYQKQNTIDHAHRKLLVDAWVTEVNEAQDMDKLLRGRHGVPLANGPTALGTGYLQKRNSKPATRCPSPTRMPVTKAEKAYKTPKKLTFNSYVANNHAKTTVKMTNQNNHCVNNTSSERKLRPATCQSPSNTAIRRKPVKSAEGICNVKTSKKSVDENDRVAYRLSLNTKTDSKAGLSRKASQSNTRRSSPDMAKADQIKNTKYHPHVSKHGENKEIIQPEEMACNMM